jgi:phosphatidylserine/phosphatidylglycerophosphate/cardiolipin synthase-like enzyme
MTLYATPEWARVMREQIDAASSRIYLSALSMHVPRNASIAPHGRLILALAAARLRKVPVKIWLAHPQPQYPATMQNAATRNWCMAQGIACRLVNDGHLLHAKTVTIDNELIWIGSGNFTAQACHSNHEAYLNIRDREAAAYWQTLLDAL